MSSPRSQDQRGRWYTSIDHTGRRVRQYYHEGTHDGHPAPASTRPRTILPTVQPSRSQHNEGRRNSNTSYEQGREEFRSDAEVSTASPEWNQNTSQNQTSVSEYKKHGTSTSGDGFDSSFARLSVEDGGHAQYSSNYTLATMSMPQPAAVPGQQGASSYVPLNSSQQANPSGFYAQMQSQGHSTPISSSTAMSYNTNTRFISPTWDQAPQQPSPYLSKPLRHVAGTEGDVEQLDESYQVRNYDYKRFFQPGRVFSTLWTEHLGSSNGEATFESQVSIVRFGQKVHSKIRRFVVVIHADRACTCLPVTTYDGKGYKKRGINLNAHGQIYSSTAPPKRISGINKLALKVNCPEGTKNLANSFVCYTRPYTVETNVKVKNVGVLNTESRRLLREYWNNTYTLSVNSDEEPLDNTPQTTASRLLGITGGNVGRDTSHTTSAGRFPPTYAQNSEIETVAYHAAIDSAPLAPLPAVSTARTANVSYSARPAISSNENYYTTTSSQAMPRSYDAGGNTDTPHQASSSNAETYTSESSAQVQYILSDRTTTTRQGRTTMEYFVRWVGDYEDSWMLSEHVREDKIKEYNWWKQEASSHSQETARERRGSDYRRDDDDYEGGDPISDIKAAPRKDSTNTSSKSKPKRHRDSDKRRKKGSGWFG